MSEKMLRVAKSTNAKSLGSAIANEFEKFDTIVLRAIGVQAVNQTVKAIAIANGFLGQRGSIIHTVIGFQNVVVEDRADTTVTALNFMCKLH